MLFIWLLFKYGWKFNFSHFSLVKLNLNYFFNRFSEIKFFNYFSKLPGIQLCKIKEIINEKSHHLCWWFLNLIAVLYHLINRFKFPTDCFNSWVFFSFQNVHEFFHAKRDLDILWTDRLEWVSEFMRNCSVGNSQELVLCMNLLI